MQSDSEFFEHLSEHSLIVRKKCRYAVWPDQIESYYKDYSIRRPTSRQFQLQREFTVGQGQLRYCIHRPTAVMELTFAAAYDLGRPGFGDQIPA